MRLDGPTRTGRKGRTQSVAALRDFEQSRRRRPRSSSVAALGGALGLSLTSAPVCPVPLRHHSDAPAPCRHRPLQESSGFAGAAAYSFGRGAGLWLAALGPLEGWGRDTAIPRASCAARGARAALDGTWRSGAPGHDRRRAVGRFSAPHRRGPRACTWSRIRRLLNSHNRLGGNEEVIDSVRGAYRLGISGEKVDLLVFRELAACRRGAGKQRRYDRRRVLRTCGGPVAR
jgi:hypothetical protein